MNGKRILLAGGTGLAGAGILHQLLLNIDDIHIRIPHRGGTGHFAADPRVSYIKADLTIPRDCYRAAEGCDFAVLAAAQTGGARQTQERPWGQVTENLVMDARILEALHVAGVKRVVYIGTASSYQDFSGSITEDQLDWNVDPPAAFLGVGWAKRSAEKLCRFWHSSGGMEILIIRLANVYGPHARFDPDTSNFVAALVRKAVDGDDPYMIWGNSEVARDILYSSDLGRAVLHMLVANQIKFDVFNIGSGKVVTVGEVAKFALDAAKHVPLKIVYNSNSPTTIAHRSLDCSKAKFSLGWSAEISPEVGIRKTTDWWRKNKNDWNR